MKKVLSMLIIILFMSTSLVLAQDKTGIPIDKAWTVVLTEDIDYSTLTNDVVTVTNNTTKQNVDITLTPVTNNKKSFLVQPKTNYDYDTTYTISIKKLKSASKKSMKKERLLTFTTISKPTTEVTPVSVEKAEITIPTNTKFDEVLTDKNRTVNVVMSDGSKQQAKVDSWLLPTNFYSMQNAEYTLEGTISSLGLKAKAHLIIGTGNSTNSNTDDNSDIGSFVTISSAPDKTLSTKDYAYEIVKELSGDKYKGRLPGTLEYKSSADYVASVFKSLGLLTVSGSYLQKYSTSLAQLNSMPSIKINNKDLVMFTDYKLHGNTASGTVNSNQTVFVGYGYSEDYTVDVKGKTVLFLGDVKSTSSVGVLDRVNIAYNKGATAALIIPNKYMPITTSEKPLKYDQGNIPCMYIAKDVASNLLGINTDTASLGAQSTATVQANIDINRLAKVDGYNVLGMIKGKNPTKTIVISASLDSYGSLPDGRVFNGASSDASGIGTVAALAKYYSANQPNYNILFAAFGSQTTLREGSKYFVENYKDLSSVLADIDIYDVGNPENSGIFNSVSTQYTDLHDTVKKLALGNIGIIDTGADVNYPFGNNYEFSTKNIPNVFVRYGESLDSLNDKINTIDVNALDKITSHIMNIINGYPFVAAPTPSVITYDETKAGKEFVSSINETLNIYETNYIKFYYEDNFKDAVKAAINNSDKPDQIFEDDIWWNEDPESLPSGKLAVYCVNDWDEGWEVTNRLDKKGTGEQSGGYQSFTDYSLSIVRLDYMGANRADDICSTIAHEFNHVCANYKETAHGTDSDNDNQEICGHVYAFGGPQSKSFYKTSVTPLSNKTAFTDVNNWTEYTGDNNKNLANSQQWNDHYNKLAAVEAYIWSKYGKEKCRDIQFDFYANPRPSVKSVVEKELNISFSQLLSDCFDWYQS